MQDIQFDHIQVNLNPRPNEIHPLDEKFRKPLAYFGRIAQEKKFAASLIVNLYNNNIVGADMNKLSAYLRGETCNTLRDGMYALIEICGLIESHEIYGSEFVEGLIEEWGFRNKRSDS